MSRVQPWARRQQRPAPVVQPDPRAELWVQAFCAVASAFNVKYASVAATWADEALAAYDKRFNTPGAGVPDA